MFTKLARRLHLKPLGREAAAGVLCTGVALIVVPLLASEIGQAPLLTKLGHQIALLLSLPW